MFTNSTTNNITPLNDNFTAGKIDFISLTEHIIETFLQPYAFEIMLSKEDVDAADSSRYTTSNLEEIDNTKLTILEESNGKTSDKGMKNLWTDKSRAMLLHLYKKYKNDFLIPIA